MVVSGLGVVLVAGVVVVVFSGLGTVLVAGVVEVVFSGVGVVLVAGVDEGMEAGVDEGSSSLQSSSSPVLLGAGASATIAEMYAGELGTHSAARLFSSVSPCCEGFG